MTSDELIKRIYDSKLSRSYNGTRGFIARHPNITYRAIFLTKDSKLAESFLRATNDNSYSVHRQRKLIGMRGNVGLLLERIRYQELKSRKAEAIAQTRKKFDDPRRGPDDDDVRVVIFGQKPIGNGEYSDTKSEGHLVGPEENYKGRHEFDNAVRILEDKE